MLADEANRLFGGLPRVSGAAPGTGLAPIARRGLPPRERGSRAEAQHRRRLGGPTPA